MTLSGLTGLGHLQVEVDVGTQTRCFHHVGELDLAPATAIRAATEQLIEPTRLLLGLELCRQELPGSGLDVEEGVAVALVEAFEAALVLAEQLLQRAEAVFELGVALAQDAFLGLIELGHRTRENTTRGGLEERLHARHRLGVVGAFALQGFRRRALQGLGDLGLGLGRADLLA